MPLVQPEMGLGGNPVRWGRGHTQQVGARCGGGYGRSDRHSYRGVLHHLMGPFQACPQFPSTPHPLKSMVRRELGVIFTFGCIRQA